MTDTSSHIPGRASVSARLRDEINRWRKGHGNVLVVQGDSAMGKGHVLSWLASLIGSQATRIDCRLPIGTFNLASIQPLQPFGHAIEQLYLQSEQAAKKRLAVNIGMSLLASIPIAGDIFYAMKAISQDLSEYKRDTAATHQKKRAAVTECVDTLRRIAERQPVALLIDDGHWCDSQSVEVLRQLIPHIADVPLLIIWAVDPTTARRVNAPLSALLQELPFVERTLLLESVPPDGTKEIVRSILPSEKFTDAQWASLHERSAGTPGIIFEYVSFLQNTGMIRDDGTIAQDALEAPGLKQSDHPATDVVLQEVSEDDAHILTLCAAEGREFTAFMISALLNVDVLSAIRTLRGISLRTGVISSIGMRTRYNVKTTVYEFSKSAAFTHFLHYAEYEERKHIHQRIAEILSREFASAELEEVRQQIAGYIAAHSSEAEDADTTQRMLFVAADGADSMGAGEVGTYIREMFLAQYANADANTTDYNDITIETDDDAQGVDGSTFSTLQALLRNIANAIIGGNALEAHGKATRYLSDAKNGGTTSERALLHCLAARACIELQQYADADRHLDAADRLPSVSQHERCTVLNTRASRALRSGDANGALEILHEASRIAAGLPVNSQILTLGNIILTLRANSDPTVERYERSMRRLIHVRGWNGIRADLMI